MNKRRLLIIILVAVFILGAVTVIAVLTKQAATTTAQPNIRGGKLLVDTPSGRVVTNNIYTNALINYPENGVGFAKSRFYMMSYSPTTDNFTIAIIDPDIKVATTVAEADFLRLLNITQIQACQLNVSLSVPYDVNPAYAGKSFSLSFCH